MDSGESKNLNLEDMMRLGVNSAKAGNKENARVIFQQVLSVDKRHVSAWLWLASLANDDIDRRRYLETVLKLSPNNPTALKQLATMDKAIQRTQNSSLRLGIILVVILVLAVVVVGGAIVVMTKLR